jgi:para-aminobenzoate synthetase/4-amino-4-deoxychorismate lyase
MPNLIFADGELAPPYVLLEDRTRPGGGGRLFTRPIAQVRCYAPEAVGEALAAVQAGLDRGHHAAGFLAYEAGAGLDPSLAFGPAAADGVPILWFGLFEGFEALSRDELDAMFGALPPPPPVRDLRFGHDREQHGAKVAAIQRLIAAGDVYQVNLTFPIRFQYTGDPLALYAALRVAQPVAHGGVVALGDRAVLSVSPELFISVAAGRVRARPMKGTAPRGPDATTDQAARDALASDPKQRAENLMITDLLRNDLSRVCEVGTVRTPALFTVETFPTFHALTSTVEGRLRADAGLPEILRALFPCGSVVGAPKIRASEIIADLEAESRGVYTGAIGAFDPTGDVSFNVAIRTAVLDANGAGRFGVGGGIVADSDPDEEYAEAVLKGRVLTDLAGDFQLIETLRWTAADGFVRRAGHLARLLRSAIQLGFDFEPAQAEALLDTAGRTWRTGPDRRVRIILRRDGTMNLSDGVMTPEPNRVLKLGVFDRTLDAADPCLRHKTSRRALYDAAAAAAVAAGCDEMVLQNRNARIADGSRNSVFVEREGRLLTPPVSAGALPGVLRGELIAEGRAVEAELTAADLNSGVVFIGNSLRGLRPAALADATGASLARSVGPVRALKGGGAAEVQGRESLLDGIGLTNWTLNSSVIKGAAT